MFFTPFPGLEPQSKSGLPGASHLLLIRHLLDVEKWTDARAEAAGLIQLSLEGIRYLDT